MREEKEGKRERWREEKEGGLFAYVNRSTKKPRKKWKDSLQSVLGRTG